MQKGQRVRRQHLANKLILKTNFFLACQNHAFLTHLIDVLISNTNIFFILKDLQVIENRRIEIS